MISCWLLISGINLFGYIHIFLTIFQRTNDRWILSTKCRRSSQKYDQHPQAIFWSKAWCHSLQLGCTCCLHPSCCWNLHSLPSHWRKRHQNFSPCLRTTPTHQPTRHSWACWKWPYRSQKSQLNMIISFIYYFQYIFSLRPIHNNLIYSLQEICL